jgi:hypothetical protein
MEVFNDLETGGCPARKKLKTYSSEHIKAMTKTFRCYYNTKDKI